MKTIELTAKTTGSYESPEVSVTEILAEGVLCVSVNHEGWQEEDVDW